MQRPPLKVSMFEIYIQTLPVSYHLALVLTLMLRIWTVMLLWVLVLQRKTSKNGCNCIEWNLQIGILKNPWLARIFWKTYTLHTAKLFCSKIYWILYRAVLLITIFYFYLIVLFFSPEIKEKENKKGQLQF